MPGPIIKLSVKKEREVPCSYDFDQKNKSIMICNHSEDHRVYLMPDRRRVVLASMFKNNLLYGEAKKEAELYLDMVK